MHYERDAVLIFQRSEVTVSLHFACITARQQPPPTPFDIPHHKSIQIRLFTKVVCSFLVFFCLFFLPKVVFFLTLSWKSDELSLKQSLPWRWVPHVEWVNIVSAEAAHTASPPGNKIPDQRNCKRIVAASSPLHDIPSLLFH